VSNDPDIVDVNKEGEVHTISSSGVSRGLDMIPFHWLSRNPQKMGKATTPEPFYALGRRNLEFRRAEAQKAGFDFVECTGDECPHHG